MVGSEGTLAHRQSRRRSSLVPRRGFRAIAVGHFSSVPAAIAATEDALACAPAAVELSTAPSSSCPGSSPNTPALGSILHGDPDALLFVTFSGDTRGRGGGRAWSASPGCGRSTVTASTPCAPSALPTRARLLKVRSAGLGLLMAASVGTRRPLAFIEDTAVAPAVLGEYTDGSPPSCAGAG